MRLLIASILAGIVMFAWGAVSHMVLGLGSSDMKAIPNEAEVTAMLKSKLSEPGFYFLPGADMKQLTEEEMAAFTAKHKEGPNAVLIYQPTGDDVMSPKQLGTEFASNVVGAFFAGLLLTLAAVGFSRGVIITTLLGLISWLSINVSYWNWYRFTTGFTRDELIEQVVGWFLSGIVLAFILRKRD